METNGETKSETKATATAAHPKTYDGGCHCGAVRFKATVDLSKGAGRCNCSICTKVSQLAGIVKPEAFALLSGEDSLSSYVWGSRTAQRYFCKHCGIHCFGRGDLPQLGGPYVSVNYNCLDGVELGDLPVFYWDGRHDNWMAGPGDRPWPILRAKAE